ncbi:MAG: NAD-dependent succinate-semialdehyde dehydrogenase [Nitrososphaeraceae archaeon]
MSNNNIIQTINPATEEVLKEYLIADKQHVSSVIDKAKEAFNDNDKGWKNNWHKRRDVLHRVSMQLKKDKEELAKVATIEMGKPIKEARSEIEKCATVIEFYAYNGEIYLHEESINTDANKSIIKFEPLGVIGSIMPWNFPYWQALRFAAPSMMAGNTIVLKPASNTIQCGIEIEKIFQKAGEGGLNGIFQTLIGNYHVAEYLIDSNIDGVTFTGSVQAGAKVAQRATSQLKKCVLELGGSDPFIVCKDADIEKASSGAVKGRFINCGQSCIASKRFFIVKDIADEFIEKFVQKTEKLRIGDPMSEHTDIGPLVNSKSLESIENLVQDAIDKGSQLVTGGEKIGNKGFFYKPTILKNVPDSSRIAKEETFGPIAPITIVNDEIEAIKLANNSEFGLGASIWTTDLEKAEKLTNMIQAGIVTVNNVVISDPRVPFGGIKKSGFGRELSRYGMLEFVNIKSVRFYDELVINHHVE